MTLLEGIENACLELAVPRPTVVLAGLNEINYGLDRITDYPCLFIIPFVVRDRTSPSGLIKSTTELNAFMLTKLVQSTMDSITEAQAETQACAPMRDLSRKMFHKLNAQEVIDSETPGVVDVQYTSVFGGFDQHVYGVSIRAQIPFVEILDVCS